MWVLLLLPSAAIGWTIGLATATPVSKRRKWISTALWVLFPVIFAVAMMVGRQCNAASPMTQSVVALCLFVTSLVSLGFATAVHSRTMVRGVFISLCLSIVFFVATAALFIAVTFFSIPWLWLGECAPTGY